MRLVVSDASSLSACVVRSAALVAGVALEEDVVKNPGATATRSLLLHLDDGTTALHEPCAAAAYILDHASNAARSQYLGTTHLQRAASIGLAQRLLTLAYREKYQPVIALLEEHLSKSKWLLGAHPTLADVVAFHIVEKTPAALNPKGLAPIKRWSDQARATPGFAVFDKPNENVLTPAELAAAEADWKTASAACLSARQPPQHPILPKEGQRNVLITSALPYVNNVPHLGNIIGCVLSADVYARYCRARGYNTLYICGTDEYGTATETKALAEGLTPRQICDKYFAVHSDVYKWFNVSFDYFGRTSTPAHTEITQEIFWKVYNNGYVIKKEEQQWYCTNCQTFLADRFVTGICPDCGYNDARGDQCDSCDHPLHAYQLKNPKCQFSKTCGKTPELRSSEHLYISLDKLQPKTEAFFAASVAKSPWSTNAQEITLGWFKTGLGPRAITRDLRWGVPVPLEGYTSKVFYVWFDAPIGYISITANYTSEWRQWWQQPDKVQLYQFMAKDNVVFHSIIFPSSLLGTHEPWTLLSHLNATEYLNYEGVGFSKSRGIGVFGNNAQESGIPSDIFRYYLLTCRPETSDADFDWNDVVARNNNELLKNIGNFVNRAITFCNTRFGGKVPKIVMTPRDIEYVAAINREYQAFLSIFETRIRMRDALRQHVLKISQLGNEYFQDNQPWVIFKENPARAGSIIGVNLNTVYLLALLLELYMPDTAESILSQLQAPLRLLPDRFVPLLPEGHAIGQPHLLFEEFDADMAEEWRAAYGGKDTEPGKVSSKVPLLPEDRPPTAEELARVEGLVEEQRKKVAEMEAANKPKVEIRAAVKEFLRRRNALFRAKGLPIPTARDKVVADKAKAAAK